MDQELGERLRRIDYASDIDKLDMQRLAKDMDNQSEVNGVARYHSSVQILHDLNERLGKAAPRSTVSTLVDIFIYLNNIGMNFDNSVELINKFPQLTSYSIENLEAKRAYLDLTKKEFKSLIVKFPQITGYSIENLEAKREYLTLTKKEFKSLIMTFPPIVGLKIENLEAKREYLTLTKDEFKCIILKFPSITGHSIENLEAKREYLMLTKDELKRLIMKFPPLISYSIENLEVKFRFYEVRLETGRADILRSYTKCSTSDNDDKIPKTGVNLGLSMYNRVMPRYVLHKRMLRENGKIFDIDKFMKSLWHSDDRFIIENGGSGAKSQADANKEKIPANVYYERAKYLCGMMRTHGSAALKSRTTKLT